MPCVWQVVNQGNSRTPVDGGGGLNTRFHYEYAIAEPPPEDEGLCSHAVIEVGKSLFIIRSGDRSLIEELRLFCASLKGSPRPEVTFTNKLFNCTEQGRLEPWAWQNQPVRAG